MLILEGDVLKQLGSRGVPVGGRLRRRLYVLLEVCSGVPFLLDHLLHQLVQFRALSRRADRYGGTLGQRTRNGRASFAIKKP